MEGVDFAAISPYVRMMRLKKVTTMLSGKWRDIDHVYTYIASGSAEFIIAGVRYQLHRGNAIIIPPYMTHMIIPDGEEPFVQYIIHFDFYDTPERRALIHKDVLDEAERQLTIPPEEDLLHQQVVVSEIPESERNRLVRRYLDMMREFQLDRPGKDIILRSECTTFLIYAWRYQIDGESRISRNPIKTKAWIHIEKAVDMCRRWVYLNPEFTMSINVSYLQLFDPQFVDFMKECVKNAGIHYQNIIVEITESKFISDKELLKRVFDSVRSLGMKIAMDDFGTGYSSLGILKEAPADIVKIDKIFVRNIKDNSFDSSFIRVVVELCHQVGIKVCLEGVEEDAEMNVVSEMDLDFIQGYLYGKPEAAEQFYQMYLQAGQA